MLPLPAWAEFIKEVSDFVCDCVATTHFKTISDAF
jgi:hypothetical protein